MQGHQPSVQGKAGFVALQSHQPSIKGQASFVALQSHQLSVQAFGTPGFVFSACSCSFFLALFSFSLAAGQLARLSQGAQVCRTVGLASPLELPRSFLKSLALQGLVSQTRTRQSQHTQALLPQHQGSAVSQDRSQLTQPCLSPRLPSSRPPLPRQARTRAEGSRPPLDPSPLTSGLAGPVDTGPTWPRTSAQTPTASGP